MQENGRGLVPARDAGRVADGVRSEVFPKHIVDFQTLFFTPAIRHRGRTGSCPTAPAQVPVCGIRHRALRSPSLLEPGSGNPYAIPRSEVYPTGNRTADLTSTASQARVGCQCCIEPSSVICGRDPGFDGGRVSGYAPYHTTDQGWFQDPIPDSAVAHSTCHAQAGCADVRGREQREGPADLRWPCEDHPGDGQEGSATVGTMPAFTCSWPYSYGSTRYISCWMLLYTSSSLDLSSTASGSGSATSDK